MAEEGMFGFRKEISSDSLLWLLVFFVVIEGISSHTFFLPWLGSAMFFARFFIYGLLAFIIFFLVFYDKQNLEESYHNLVIISLVFLTAFAWPYLFSFILKYGFLTQSLYNLIVSVFHPFLLYLFLVHHIFFPESPFRKYFIFAVFFLFVVFGLTTINAIQAGSFDIPWMTPAIEETNFLGAWYSVIKGLYHPVADLVKEAYYLIFGKFLGVAKVPSEDGGLAKEGIAGFIEKRVAFATGRVEKGAEKKLGVFLDSIKQTGPFLYAGSPVGFYSVLRAETLDKSAINVYLSCKLKNQTNVLEADTYIPQQLVQIFDRDYRNVECVFANVPAGAYTSVMQADFDFETTSYLKSYFIDIDTLSSLRRANVDFFQHYKIADKSPVAQSTAGPVLIGIGVDQQPLVVDYKSIGQKIPLAIKLNNNWEGIISNLKEFIIAVPKGLKLIGFYGLKGEIKPELDSCNSLSTEEQAVCDDGFYTIYNIPANQKNIKSDVRYGAVLEVENPSELLGAVPPAIQYFKVNVRYTYSLKKEKSVVVEKFVE